MTVFGNSEIFLDPARVPEHMQVKIKDALRFLEYQNGYKILFAYESGSRAWNFHSPDSDYDVRFVYVRDKDNYLSLSPARDVCESFKSQAKGTAYEDDLLDIVGWDLSKALHLMRKSNPQLIEWLNGPLPYYVADPAFNQHLLSISRRITRMEPIYMHYRGMATGNFREYLQGDEVRYKKWCYVLRPLLAAQYIRERKTFPPVDFFELLAATEGAHSEKFRDSVRTLMMYKMGAKESDMMPQDPVLYEWANEQFVLRFDGFDEPEKLSSEKVTEILDGAFTSALEKWGN